MKKRVGLWVAAILAVAVAAGAWIRVARGGWVTGPHEFAWRGPDDKPIPRDDGNYGRAPCTSMMDDAIVLGDRVILGCSKSDRLPSGWAWLDPKTATAKLAWPLPPGIDTVWLTGVTARDAQTFAVALRTEVDGKTAIVVGIAGRDGWLRPPAVVAGTPKLRHGGPLLLAMAWVSGELEVVATHPYLGDPIREDPYGNWQPPDVIRLPVKGAPIVTSRPTPEGAYVVGALPTARGWKIVVRSTSGQDASIVDEDGKVAAAPPELAWWGAYEGGRGVDKSALGTLWGHTMPDSPTAERDGTRRPPPAAPVTGLHPIHAFRRFELVDGILRARRLFGATPTSTELLARAVGDRAIVIAQSTHDEDLQMIGDRVDALRPLLYNSTSYDFRTAAVVPAADGYYIVSGDAEYVTVDRELRRSDERSLWHHLRTRGSVGDFIDEPRHVVLMGWALFGLPVALLVGLLLARKGGDKALTTALATYAISGAIALAIVSPLLSNT